jgi:hypothetical protein
MACCSAIRQLTHHWLGSVPATARGKWYKLEALHNCDAMQLSVFTDEWRKENDRRSRKGTPEIMEATSTVEVKVNLYPKARADIWRTHSQTRRWMKVCGQRHASVGLPRRHKPGNHCTRSWLGLAVSQDGEGNSPLPRGFEHKATRSRVVTYGTNTNLVLPPWFLTLRHRLGDNRSGGTWCFHFEGRTWRQQILPSRWKPPNTTHGVTMQVTTIQIFTDWTNVKLGKSHAKRNFNNVTDLHRQQQERLRYNHIQGRW